MLSESVEIVEVNPLKVSNPTVVTGLSGVGLVGYIAIMHIIKQRGLEPNAILRSHLIPPMMVLVDGKPYPPFLVYGDYKGETLFVVSTVMVSLENSWRVGHRLMEWFKEKAVKEFITLEALPQAIQPGRRPIFGFAVPKRDLSSYGVSNVMEGSVSGLNAVLLEEAMSLSKPFTNLIIPTSVTSAVDFSGALSVVEVLNHMLGLNVDVSPLEAAARHLESRVSKKSDTGDILNFLRRGGTSSIN